ncbi:MAG TPA: hypothetical protein VFB14_24700 [Bryobacteraceae bacterium]|jgi:hypothetical protein|nr:hypothetical protein [Bryobacteraceae bacterium]
MKFVKREARNHVVTFRLTQPEYERLKTVCEESGSSISDGARSAVLALSPEMELSGVADIPFDKFEKKLDQIIDLLRGLNT